MSQRLVVVRSELDQSKRAFHPGEKLSGVFSLDVEAECQQAEVVAELLWYIPGTSVKGGREAKSLFKGSLQEGKNQKFPFEFRLPNGPFSFEGELFEVRWLVRGRLIIKREGDWKERSAKVEERFELVAPARLDEEALANEPYRGGAVESPGFPSIETRNKRRARKWTGELMSGIFLILVVGAVMWSNVVASDFEESYWLLMLAIMGPVVLLALFGLMAKPVRKMIAQKRLGRVQVSLSSYRVLAGESVEVILEIPPGPAVHINRVSATLSGREYMVRGSGKLMQIDDVEFYGREEEMEGSQNRAVKRAEAVRLKHVFEVPPDAVPTFYEQNSQVQWAVKIHVDIARWPDWTEIQLLEVLPGPSPTIDASHRRKKAKSDGDWKSSSPAELWL